MRYPPSPSIQGLWRGESTCVECSLDPDCKDESGLFRFAAFGDSTNASGRKVDWRQQGDEDNSRQLPLEERFGGGGWESARPIERGTLGWEFAVLGDTLVGQLIDPYTRIVAREFRATRASA